ncbi:hypothetical protein V8V91_07585 [Algoriphagus halophilus]|uniref:hypothetical protein n=1 Tax=Algoriphagus halophilus TaxID=226505 RepID=UPI00358EF95F
MSRGFVKEEDQEETPLVPPRVELPNGVTNYVTENGLAELLSEKEALLEEKPNFRLPLNRKNGSFPISSMLKFICSMNESLLQSR